MKFKQISIILFFTNLFIAEVAYCQYFQKLYDCDTTFDWARDIFLRNDNNYFTISDAINTTINRGEITSMIISSDGNTIVNKKSIIFNNSFLYVGNAGEVKKNVNGDYIIPLSFQTPNITYGNSKAGFIKLDSIGDTIFMKTYFDTSICFTFLEGCTILQSGGYLGGGGSSERIV